MDLNRTTHAQARHQNRGTLPLFESLVLDYGTWTRSNGANVVFIDKAARKRLRHAVGGDRGLRFLEPSFNQYLVVGDDGRIITAGFRTQRIKRA